MADNVLECLSELACLYGEHFILSQYFSYAIEIVESCQGKKSLGWNTEGGLLGCLEMVSETFCLPFDHQLNFLHSRFVIVSPAYRIQF